MVSNLITLDVDHDHTVVSVYEHGRFNWGLPGETVGAVIFLCRSYLWTVLGLFRLRKCIKTQKPDILHIHLNGSRIIWFLASLGLKRKPVVVWHEHSGVEPIHIYGPLFGRILATIFRFIRNNTFVLSNSKDSSTYLQKELKIPEAQTKTILCPINISSILEASESINSAPEATETQGPVIGYVGRLSPQKGVDQLVELSEPILRDNPKMRFWIVGDGPERKELERQVQQSVLSDRYCFWGQRRDVFSIMKNMDVLLMPSQYEPYGLVAMEALIAKTAVVGYSVGGLADILERHPMGFSVPLNDKQAFSKKVTEALSDVASRQASEHGYEDTTPAMSEFYKAMARDLYRSHA